jgi:hypothetical protein
MAGIEFVHAHRGAFAISFIPTKRPTAILGYHTPLTSEQIAELFHAGRVDRHHPCKPTAKSEWGTIDELFPLLKYDSTS